VARMDHEKADARDRAQTLINLEVRRYARRLKQTAEDEISVAYDRARAAGLPFDHVAAADAAVEVAQRQYVAAELPAGDDRLPEDHVGPRDAGF